MTYRGHVKNGLIALDDPVQLPEGTEVSILVVDEGQNVLSKVSDLAVPGELPADFSEQHDHYIKGTPRK
jgi:hypothetical protein